MMQPNTQASAPSQQQINVLGENLHMPQMSSAHNGMYQQQMHMQSLGQMPQ